MEEHFPFSKLSRLFVRSRIVFEHSIAKSTLQSTTEKEKTPIKSVKSKYTQTHTKKICEKKNQILSLELLYFEAEIETKTHEASCVSCYVGFIYACMRSSSTSVIYWAFVWYK